MLVVYVYDESRDSNYQVICKSIATSTIQQWAVLQGVISTIGLDLFNQEKKLKDLYVHINSIYRVEVYEKTDKKPVLSLV